MQILKKALLVGCIAFSAVGMATAKEGHDHVHAITSTSHADVREFPECLHCGMDREKFSHSRMLVMYADGTKVGTCSISCVAREKKKNPGKEIRSLQVADYDTRKLHEAKDAIWVIGGTKRGVMSPVAKWAFGSKEAAEQFVRVNGGKIAGFAEAMNMAQEDPPKQKH